MRGSIIATVVVAAVLAACGSESDAPGGETASIVATTSIWADITSRVLCDIEVPAMIPTGADPHTFEPSLRDRELLEDAEVVVANGAGLEESLTDLLGAVAADDTNVIEFAAFVDTIEGLDDHDDHEGQDDHDDGGDAGEHSVDPHLWQDPSRVSDALDSFVAALGSNGTDECVAAYRSELDALDAEIVGLIAAVPSEDRIMVTSHDSLAYFADRYDLEIVGTVIPSTNTLAQTNAADLADLADVIEERGVTAIFTEELESTADADALAERLGVRVVPLVTDALTDDPETDTYVEMMRANATRIAEALTR